MIFFDNIRSVARGPHTWQQHFEKNVFILGSLAIYALSSQVLMLELNKHQQTNIFLFELDFLRIATVKDH